MALKTRLPSILSVSPRTIGRWSRRIDKDAKDAQQREAFGLWLACHTQESIADRLGVPQQTVARWLEDLTDFRQMAKIGKVAAHFQDYGALVYNAWKYQAKAGGDVTDAAPLSDQEPSSSPGRLGPSSSPSRGRGLPEGPWPTPSHCSRSRRIGCQRQLLGQGVGGVRTLRESWRPPWIRESGDSTGSPSPRVLRFLEGGWCKTTSPG